VAISQTKYVISSESVAYIFFRDFSVISDVFKYVMYNLSWIWGSSFIIVSDYDWTIRVRCPAEAEDFSSSLHVQGLSSAGV
jgi:hypothetical protein